LQTVNIVFFAHPAFTAHQSMPRFASMLAEGMRNRGHTVELRVPQARFVRLPLLRALRKWLGYVDQYVVFPGEMRRALKHYSRKTLFVFTDQALGPWVPLVADRPHVIHCHDFLAQRSAVGEISENPTGWTGRQYQAYIRRGYRQGRHFLSVSQTTRRDLHRFLPTSPAYSEVVYNGLNRDFSPHQPAEARAHLAQELELDPSRLQAGYLLHVGGNQWYKNRVGVIELYTAWRARYPLPLPLLLIGEAPGDAVRLAWEASAVREDIHLLSGVGDAVVRLAYAGATVFLFPSLAEGFGWPIAEAMAAGCPVITTAEAPMTEVGGTAAFYIPRRPSTEQALAWAAAGAEVIEQVVALGPSQRAAAAAAGLVNAGRFEAAATLDQLEAIYQHILHTYENA
jgi:glycosyltransferase involved in cell wall biosynthesis